MYSRIPSLKGRLNLRGLKGTTKLQEEVAQMSMPLTPDTFSSLNHAYWIWICLYFLSACDVSAKTTICELNKCTWYSTQYHS